MGRLWWGVWWLSGLAVPLVQFHATSVEESGLIALALWWATAGWLSLWTPQQREIRVGWLAVVVMAWLAHPLLVAWPGLQRSEWIDAWGIVARLTSAGVVALCCAWGTASVLRHSPRMDQFLPWVLAGLLAVNLLGFHLQAIGGWDGYGRYEAQAGSYTRWLWNEPADLGGFFSSKTVWSAWAIISLPLTLGLRGWRKFAAIPSALGVWGSHRTTVFLALLAWGLWRLWPRFRRQPLLWGGLAVFIGWWCAQVEDVGSMVAGVAPRLATWPVILQAIASHPLGMGWNPMAYFEIIHSAPHPIMGHPSSSLLAWTLAGGWALGAGIVAGCLYGLRHLQRDGLGGALVVCGVLLLISRTIAQAQVGVLAWVLACLWWMNHEEARHA